MSKRIAWEKVPSKTEQSNTGTTITFRLLNGRLREQGVQLPHTFTSGNIVVTNRLPDQVLVDKGSIYGNWTVPRTTWKTTPQSVRRKDFDTLVVTFEPEESKAYAKNTAALKDVPHTFRINEVTVTNQKPAGVVTVRGGSLCPCYGYWNVTNPLSNPQWSSDPYRILFLSPKAILGPSRLPWRGWSDSSQVFVEYEFFKPKNNNQTDWEAVAKGTSHQFQLAGIKISKPPNQDSWSKRTEYLP